MPPRMRSVFSSHVDSIGYDGETGELHVRYRGTYKGGAGVKTAIYANVPPDVAARVMSAPSIGEALHAHVKGKYDHGYI